MKFEKSAKKSERKNCNVDFELDLIEFNCWKRRNLTETSKGGREKGERNNKQTEKCASHAQVSPEIYIRLNNFLIPFEMEVPNGMQQLSK